MIKVRPGFILLRKIYEKDLKVGSIYLPNTTRNLHGGEVVQMGELSEQLKIGDRVLVDHFAGTTFEVREGRFLVVRESEVLLIVRREDATSSGDEANT